jgi:hypothetical protein
MKKGIIAAPAVVSGNGAQFRSERGLTLEELRYFLLYWDKVVIPTTNIIHLQVPQEDALLTTGVVTRPRVPFSGTFNGELMARAQLLAQTAVASDLINNDRSTDWTLHQIGSELIVPDQASIEKQLIRVDLTSSLPVPSGEVPFADILEFKERRKDELVQLHQAVDDLYLEILSSPDRSLKSKQAVSKFRQAIESLDSVTAEKWKSTRKFDFSAELNLSGKEVAAGVASGAVFDFYSNLFTIPVGIIVGTVATVIKVRAGFTKSFEPSKEKRVLGYLASAHSENILPSKRRP